MSVIIFFFWKVINTIQPTIKFFNLKSSFRTTTIGIITIDPELPEPYNFLEGDFFFNAWNVARLG